MKETKFLVFGAGYDVLQESAKESAIICGTKDRDIETWH